MILGLISNRSELLTPGNTAGKDVAGRCFSFLLEFSLENSKEVYLLVGGPMD